MLMKIALSLLGLLLVAALGLLVAGQLGALQGKPPTDLGITNGRLKALSNTPNCVSSQAGLSVGHPMQQTALIAPLPLGPDPAATMARLRQVVSALPGAAVVEQRNDYLYARFTSRWLHFVDDAEFWVDPAAQVIQVRSASRVGRKDFGVNRERVELIRERLATG